jgi:hypothetical protein
MCEELRLNLRFKVPRYSLLHLYAYSAAARVKIKKAKPMLKKVKLDWVDLTREQEEGEKIKQKTMQTSKVPAQTVNSQRITYKVSLPSLTPRLPPENADRMMQGNKQHA